MFPGRFPWVAVGSGEALNEHVTGDPWPTKDVRMARLRECVDVMRALWRGEEVTHRGLVVVDRARVWTLPDEPPRLVAGAISAETAAWAAGSASRLITVNQPPELLRKVVDAYRDAGGRGDLHLQVHLSWARDDDEALAVAHEKWRSNCLPTSLAWELETPEQFEAATGTSRRRRWPATCWSPRTRAGWPTNCARTRSSASPSSTCTRSARTTSSSTSSAPTCCPPRLAVSRRDPQRAVKKETASVSARSVSTGSWRAPTSRMKACSPPA